MHGGFISWKVAVLATCVLSAAVLAQTPQFTPATEQAIRAYTLDQARANVLIKALREGTAATLKDPAGMSRLMKQMELPFEQQIAALDKDPIMGPVLKANNLSPQQYSFGVLALRAAYLARSGGADGLARLASPANVAFLKANPDIAQRFGEAEMGK